MQDKRPVGERKGKPVHMRVFHLIDSSGSIHPAAEGQDTGSGDGHYVYRGSVPGFAPISCTSRRSIISWYSKALSLLT